MPRPARTPLHLAALLHTAGWRGREERPGSRAGVPGGGLARPVAGVPTVTDTVRALARPARQQDGTTCGSAVLTVLAAVGDPSLAAWLTSGRLPQDLARPPELSGAPAGALARLATAGTVERAGVVHRVVKGRTARSGLPWPPALGTSPWGAARLARFPGVRWTQHPLGGPASVRAHLQRVAGWVDLGIPVPLYSGGDLRQGWAAAVPRHVVLVVGHRHGLLDVWEPSQGAVVSVWIDRLASGAGPLPALGGWTHVVWALVPWRVGAPRARMGPFPRPRGRGSRDEHDTR